MFILIPHHPNTLDGQRLAQRAVHKSSSLQARVHLCSGFKSKRLQTQGPFSSLGTRAAQNFMYTYHPVRREHWNTETFKPTVAVILPRRVQHSQVTLEYLSHNPVKFATKRKSVLFSGTGVYSEKSSELFSHLYGRIEYFLTFLAHA